MGKLNVWAAGISLSLFAASIWIFVMSEQAASSPRPADFGGASPPVTHPSEISTPQRLTVVYSSNVNASPADLTPKAMSNEPPTINYAEKGVLPAL